MKKKNKEKAARREKLSRADKKGVLLVTALAVVAIALSINFVSLLGGGRVPEQAPVTNGPQQEQSTTQAPTEQITTTAPVVTEPDSPTEENTSTAATEPSATDSVKDEKQEILDIITQGINTLKSSDASFIGHKEQVLDMELTECSAPAFVGIINKIMNMFIETEIYDFDFTNGKGMDPENKVETTTMDTFPPEGKNFSLTIDGVAEATKEQQGENTVYRVKLKPEKSTKDNPKTLYHENACDTLDLSTFNMPIGEITRADLEYPGAVVGITLDKDGRVIGYYERLDIIGTGEAAAIGMSGGGTVEGYIDETWTIEWK